MPDRPELRPTRCQHGNSPYTCRICNRSSQQSSGSTTKKTTKKPKKR